jgi:hypothetical protein
MHVVNAKDRRMTIATRRTIPETLKSVRIRADLCHMMQAAIRLRPDRDGAKGRKMQDKLIASYISIGWHIQRTFEDGTIELQHARRQVVRFLLPCGTITAECAP